LGLNRIRNKGAAALAKALETNTTIQKLGLKLNFMKNKGALAIIDAIVVNKNSKISTISFAGNEIEDSVLLQIKGKLEGRESQIDFDLKERVLLMDADRIERRVWVSPLPIRATRDMIKKFFLDNNCGVVSDVDLHDHKRTEGGTKYRYAFVEFAHKNSVELALSLPPSKAKILSKRIGVYRAGSQTKGEIVTEDTNQRAERGGGSSRGRGASRGGRGGRGGSRSGSRGGGRGGSRGGRGGRGGGRGRGRGNSNWA